MFENGALVFGLLLICGLLSAKAAPLPPAQAGALRILSYNVRNGRGMDDKHDLERIAKVINAVGADVVALQELDWFTKRYDIPVISNLAAMVNMHYAYGPAIDYGGGKYGVGVLSKDKPLAQRQVALPGRERRTFLMVEFENYIFCCTHLALQEVARMESAKLITAAVRNTTKPLFMAGDLNAQPTEGLHKELAQTFTMLSGTTQFTYPADKPTICIDYIYALRNNHVFKVLATGVIDEAIASDHRPIYVDLLLEKRP